MQCSPAKTCYVKSELNIAKCKVTGMLFSIFDLMARDIMWINLPSELPIVRRLEFAWGIVVFEVCMMSGFRFQCWGPGAKSTASCQSMEYYRGPYVDDED